MSEFLFDYSAKQQIESTSWRCLTLTQTHGTAEKLHTAVAGPHIANTFCSVLGGSRRRCYSVASMAVVVNNPQDASIRVNELALNSNGVAVWSQSDLDVGDFSSLQARYQLFTAFLDGIEVVLIGSKVKRLIIPATAQSHAAKAGNNVSVEIAIISHFDPRRVNFQHLSTDRNKLSIIAKSARFQPRTVDYDVVGSVQVSEAIHSSIDDLPAILEKLFARPRQKEAALGHYGCEEASPLPIAGADFQFIFSSATINRQNIFN